jgi:hypothetical protein
MKAEKRGKGAKQSTARVPERSREERMSLLILGESKLQIPTTGNEQRKIPSTDLSHVINC